MIYLDACVIVIGPNVWGKGETLTEALANAGKPKAYVAYLAPKDAGVDPVCGDVCYPYESQFRPIMIDRKQPKAR